MANAHLPPVPPAGISPKGPGPHQDHAGDMSGQVEEANKSGRDRNLAEQGRQGNIKQNTTQQGGGHGRAQRDRDDHGRAPGEATNPDHGRVSGGGGERDRHHVHDPASKS